jgi:hypothetical protein
MALENRVALGNRDLPHHPAHMRADDVLHLHRFHHEKLLALAHQFAFAHVDRDDGPLHRGGDRDRIFRADDFVMRGGVGLDRHRARRRRRIDHAFAVAQHRQRIDRVDFGPGQLPRARRALVVGAARRLGRAVRLGEKELAMSRVRRRGGQFGDVFLDEAGIEPVRGEIGMPQQALEKSDIGCDALDPELAERAIGPRHRRGEVRRRRVRDELGQQRIEARVGGVAGIGERIHAQAGPRR